MHRISRSFVPCAPRAAVFPVVLGALLLNVPSVSGQDLQVPSYGQFECPDPAPEGTSCVEVLDPVFAGVPFAVDLVELQGVIDATVEGTENAGRFSAAPRDDDPSMGTVNVIVHGNRYNSSQTEPYTMLQLLVPVLDAQNPEPAPGNVLVLGIYSTNPAASNDFYGVDVAQQAEVRVSRVDSGSTISLRVHVRGSDQFNFNGNWTANTAPDVFLTFDPIPARFLFVGSDGRVASSVLSGNLYIHGAQTVETNGTIHVPSGSIHLSNIVAGAALRTLQYVRETTPYPPPPVP